MVLSTPNAQTTSLTAVSFTATTLTEDESNCKQKFHDLNTMGGLAGTAITATEANRVILAANAAIKNADRVAKMATLVSSNSTGEFVGVIPAGYIMTNLVFVVSTAGTGAVTATVGNVHAGEQFMASASITHTAAAITMATVVSNAPSATAQDVHIDSADWKGCVFTVYMILKKVIY